MKKGLLGSTALVAATALTAGMAQAAEAPTLNIGGFMNFQIYYADRDAFTAIAGGVGSRFGSATAGTWSTGDLYFGTDDAELHFNVSGTADNGLEYGFKIELEATQNGRGAGGGAPDAADEARIQLGGSWGILQLGDEDGAEDTMNYGGENLLGASGGWDGDGDDMTSLASIFFPNLAGDTSDATKITYYTPRFSGFQLGASWAPHAVDGDRVPFDDTPLQNWFGLGANYDNSFGNTRLRLSAVYAAASNESNTNLEDISSWSVGGIVDFAGFGIGANYTDNAESATFTGFNSEHSYWNAAVGWEGGPHYVSLGYIAHTYTNVFVAGDLEPTAISATYDYTVAPGLGVYAEWTGYDSDAPSSDASVFILGANVSF